MTTTLIPEAISAERRSVFYFKLWNEITKLMSKAGCTDTQISDFLPEIKSLNVMSMKGIELCDIRVILESVNIEEAKVSQIGENIVALLNGVEPLYCVIELEGISVYSSMVKAVDGIEYLKTLKHDGYYDGSFKAATRNIAVFEYEHLKRASETTVDDFLVNATEVELCQIFEQPVVDLVVIDVNIKCVPQSGIVCIMKEGMKEGMKRGVKRGIEMFSEEPEHNFTKEKAIKLLTDVMEDCTVVVAPNDDATGVVACENAMLHSELFQLSNPDEDSMNISILEQIKKYAISKNYSVSTNKSILSSDIPQGHRYSKHASSRPDLTVLKEGTGLFVFFDNDDLSKSMEAMGMAEESKKRSTTKTKDPIGQLMGNINKLVGDIIYRAIRSYDLIPTKMTLFGLFVEAVDDQCTVYKAILQPNKTTQMLKCRKTLTISEAVNRVFSEMSHLYDKN